MFSIPALQDVPEPMGSLVSHWQNDENIGMAYSYVPTGSSGECYETLAQPVAGRILFAGEVRPLVLSSCLFNGEIS